MRGVKATNNLVYKINGVFLWLTFVIFRLVLFSHCLRSLWVDSRDHPAVTVDTITTFEYLLYPTTNVLLLVMSTVWFVGITKGMLKQIGVLKSSKKSAKTN